MLRILWMIPFPLYLFGAAWRPLIFAGLGAQLVYVFSRGFILGRLPLVGVHDTLSFLAASTVLFAIPLYPKMKDNKEFFPIIAGLAAVFTAFSMASAPHSTPLPPVLKTYWFELHVILSFFSYALFGVSLALGVSYLRNQEDASIERMQYKSVLIGYSLFSLSMIAGGIWAFYAWGTYWLWTPKEAWTTILWLFYTFYLHARFRPWWSGRPSAVLGIVGFFVVMFTYLGVGLLMKSSHSF